MLACCAALVVTKTFGPVQAVSINGVAFTLITQLFSPRLRRRSAAETDTVCGICTSKCRDRVAARAAPRGSD